MSIKTNFYVYVLVNGQWEISEYMTRHHGASGATRKEISKALGCGPGEKSCGIVKIRRP